MRSNAVLLLGALAGIALVFLIPHVLDRVRSASPGVRSFAGGPPVTVVVVSGPNEVQLMRESISEDRVLASSERAFAVDGRIVTSAVQDVGPILTELGWGERPVEVHAVRADPSKFQFATSREEDGAGYADLIQKDSLTLPEAATLLQESQY